MDKKIFLSYNWKNKNIADSIDTEFKDTPITIIRDERNLEYKQSIKAFMKQIRNTDYAIMIISDEYLKSSNCMYEVCEFIKDENYKDRIIPIILKDIDIFIPEKKITYLEYWNNKYDELEKSLHGQTPESCLPLYEELKHYSKIKTEIIEFLSVLSDMNNVVIENEMSKENFQTIKRFLKVENYKRSKCVLTVRKKNKEQDIHFFEQYLQQEEIVNYKILTTSLYHSTFLLEVFVNDKSIFSKKMQKIIEEIDFEFIDFFEYEDSYYILSMRKTWESGSDYILWYAPCSQGYTENIQEAGIFSSAAVKEEMNWNTDYQKDDIIGVPKILYDEKVKLPILLYQEKYQSKIEILKDSIIGEIDWGRKSYYSRPWKEVMEDLRKEREQS